MRLLGAKWTHRYEDRASRRLYVVPEGGVLEVPDAVAELLVTSHPDKVYYADLPEAEEAGRAAVSSGNRMAEPRVTRADRRRADRDAKLRSLPRLEDLDLRRTAVAPTQTE